MKCHVVHIVIAMNCSNISNRERYILLFVDHSLNFKYQLYEYVIVFFFFVINLNIEYSSLEIFNILVVSNLFQLIAVKSNLS